MTCIRINLISTLRNVAVVVRVLRVTHLLLGLPASPAYEGARPRLHQRVLRLRGPRFVFLRRRTSGPPAGFAGRDVGARTPFQPTRFLRIPGEYLRQRKEGAEYLLDVDVVLRRALQDLDSEIFLVK